MTDYIIPCDTVARLAKLTTDEHGPWFASIRLDNGRAIASNRGVMAVENIGGNPGVIHLVVDDALRAQCENEAKFKSSLTITVVEALQFATAKTTYGYVHPANCAVWSNAPNELDRWQAIVMQCETPATECNAAMYWYAPFIAMLGEAAPSNRIVFESVIDIARPTLVRDPIDPNWFGIFQPWPRDLPETYEPATLPGWVK